MSQEISPSAAARAASRVTGVILAGGLASRYGGTPKGLERVAGVRILDRVASALAATTDSLLLVANDPAADAWLPGVRRVADVLPGLGTLGGIHAALAHAPGAILVVAWDMPFVPSSLLAELRSLGETEGADAAVPESDSKRGLEPTCAYYTEGCRAPIESRLAAGDRRVVAFYDDVRIARLPAERVRRHGDPAHIFLNVNTPDDLARAERTAAAVAPGTESNVGSSDDFTPARGGAATAARHGGRPEA
ncbi:MAG TPA: molybdenum cofactor guanylyltransferase [Gemmatimonadaceae bacterium]|nr:molybdenum cofactor guanylyltransferase [Gemmatimonadaceae bacterium]